MNVVGNSQEEHSSSKRVNNLLTGKIYPSAKQCAEERTGCNNWMAFCKIINIYFLFTNMETYCIFVQKV
jgi:hypothetical protein